MGFDTYRIPVTTAGTAGVAAGTVSKTLNRPGILNALYINFTSQPVTTDVTIAQTIDGVSSTIHTSTNSATDVLVIPVLEPVTGAFYNVPLFGQITVTVAQGDAITDGVVVTLHVES